MFDHSVRIFGDASRCVAFIKSAQVFIEMQKASPRRIVRLGLEDDVDLDKGPLIGEMSKHCKDVIAKSVWHFRRCRLLTSSHPGQERGAARLDLEFRGRLTHSFQAARDREAA